MDFLTLVLQAPRRLPPCRRQRAGSLHDDPRRPGSPRGGSARTPMWRAGSLVALVPSDGQTVAASQKSIQLPTTTCGDCSPVVRVAPSVH